MIGSFVVVSTAVGGAALSVDKLGLLAPYIGLATVILGLFGTMIFYVRRKARKAE
jgi:nitrate reductase gamma subunit